MSATNAETIGTETGPSSPEALVNEEEQARYETEQRSTGHRMGLASEIGEAGDAARKAAANEAIDRVSNRSPEQVLTAMRGVLNEASLGELGKNRPRFLTSGGHASIETNHGIQTASGNNEAIAMQKIDQRLRHTSKLRYNPNRKELNQGAKVNTYFVMYQGKATIQREKLEQDLIYVSDAKRYITPERAEYFEKYKQILRDLRSATVDPKTEMIYLNNHGSVAIDQELEHHCTDPENAKGALKVLAMGGLAVLLAINGVNNFRSGTFSIFTLALLGGLVALKGKDSKYDMLTGTGFTNFSRDKLSRSDAQYIFSHPKERRAMIKYFGNKSRTKGEMITQEDVDALTERGKGKTPVKPEIAAIFLGMPSSHAYNYLKGLGKISTDKNKGIALDFIEANHQDGGQTAEELQQIVARPEEAAAATVEAPKI
jgi:hypothetical protein